jgi:hypothetical protein
LRSLLFASEGRLPAFAVTARFSYFPVRLLP